MHLPSFAAAVIHVLDASRSVVVVSSLLDPQTERRSEYVQEVSSLPS